MTTTLTTQQMRDLLAGAGPSLTSRQVEQLEGAIRENAPITAEELELLSVPVVRE